MKQKHIVLAALLAAAPMAGAGYAQAAPLPARASAATQQAAASVQPHFVGAIAAFARKDYRAAATEIRNANRYLRQDARRARGDARDELDSAAAQLDKLASAVEAGGVHEEKSLRTAFTKADHALALEHRAEAAQSWARKDYRNAGYELKAAAHALQGAAHWSGEQAQAAASATVADTKVLGDRLASGAAYTRAEVAKGFAALGNGIDVLGRGIAGAKTAAPLS